MKSKTFSISIRVMSILLCMCMLLPMFTSCGFFESIFPPPQDDDPGSVTTPAETTTDKGPDDTPPGGDTETTYYKVSFAIALEEYKNRITLPEAKLYKEGTQIQYLPTPAVKDLLFMGWYYDAAMTRAVELTDTVNSDLVLYAKVVDTSEDISVIEGVYYHTVYDVEPSYTFSIKANNIEDVKNGLSLANISSAGSPLVLDEDYTIADNGDGTFKVTVAYKAGNGSLARSR